MANVSGLVSTAIYNRLSDPSIGFNPNYALVAPNYQTFQGVPVDPISIDFSPGSVNFTFGRVPPDLIQESSALQYPLLTISAERAQMWGQTKRVHYAQFTGVVTGAIEVHLSWLQEGVIDEGVAQCRDRCHVSNDAGAVQQPAERAEFLGRRRAVRL